MKVILCAMSLLVSISALGDKSDSPFLDTLMLGYEFGDYMHSRDIITPNDLSTFKELNYQYSTPTFHYFEATFTDGLTLSVEASTKRFSEAEAAKEFALPIVKAFGSIPYFLREAVEIYVIDPIKPEGMDLEMRAYEYHKEIRYIGGSLARLQNRGILAEMLTHEAAHLIQSRFLKMKEWKNARRKDNQGISEYSYKNPNEDVAESIVAWVGARLRPGRLLEDVCDTINNTIPNRLDVLDSLNLNIYPLVKPANFNNKQSVKSLFQEDDDFVHTFSRGEPQLFENVYYKQGYSDEWFDGDFYYYKKEISREIGYMQIDKPATLTTVPFQLDAGLRSFNVEYQIANLLDENILFKLIISFDKGKRIVVKTKLYEEQGHQVQAIRCNDILAPEGATEITKVELKCKYNKSTVIPDPTTLHIAIDQLIIKYHALGINN